MEINVENYNEVNIGEQGDNLATVIVFDISNWIKEYGEGVATLAVKRPNEDFYYPVVLEQVGDKAKWTVTSVDTAISGTGEMRLSYSVGELLANRRIFETVIARGIDGAEGEVPDVMKGYIEQITELSVKVENNAKSAEQSELSAKDSADKAEQAKALASDAERRASEHATASENSAVASKNSADVASQAVTTINGAEQRITLVEQNVTNLEQNVQQNATQVEQSVNHLIEISESVAQNATSASESAKSAEQSKAAVEETEKRINAKAEEIGKAVTDGLAVLDSATTEKKKEIVTEGDAQTARVTEEGNAQTDRVVAEGNTQVDRVIAEGDKQAERLNIVDDFANAIKPKASGNPVVLTDSRDAKLAELEVSGRTTQVTTTGKNLFDKAKEPTEIDVTGTGVFRFGVEIPLIKGEYVISLNEYSEEFFCKTVFDDQYGNATSLSVDRNVTMKNDGVIQVYGSSAVSYTGFVVNAQIQIEKGSVATEYEPYTGGKPSPSPEYTQEIVNGEWDRIGCIGKNLFDEKTYFEKIGYKLIDGAWAGNQAKETIFENILGLKLKTFSYDFKSSNINAGTFIIEYTDGQEQYTAQSQLDWTHNSVPFMKGKIVRKIVQTFGDLGTAYFKNIMLSIEDSANYEAYKGFSETFPKIELSEWDRVLFKNGQWWKENGTASQTFDGTEDFRKEFIANFGMVVIQIILKGVYGTEMYCNFGDAEYSNQSGISVGFKIKSFNVTTFEEFIALVKKKYNEGNPLKIVYKSYTPIYEVLPQETQEVLNKLVSYYPNTVIQTNDGIELNIKYVADTQNYIDRRILELTNKTEAELNNLTALALER